VYGTVCSGNGRSPPAARSATAQARACKGVWPDVDSLTRAGTCPQLILASMQILAGSGLLAGHDGCPEACPGSHTLRLQQQQQRSSDVCNRCSGAQGPCGIPHLKGRGAHAPWRRPPLCCRACHWRGWLRPWTRSPACCRSSGVAADCTACGVTARCSVHASSSACTRLRQRDAHPWPQLA